jgi:hypothetical protein
MRDVKGIALASIALAAYEAYALTQKKPTVTQLSHRRPYSFLIWGWLAALVYHLIYDWRR